MGIKMEINYLSGNGTIRPNIANTKELHWTQSWANSIVSHPHSLFL
jgi:hypothetical protein